MNTPRWIGRDECLAIHEMLLARHGGTAGVRDEALLQQALAQPRDKWAADCTSLPALAACYATAIVTSHPFVSGNNCTGFLVATTFLGVNGLVFTGRGVPTVEETLALARGDSPEAFYGLFLKCNSRAP